MTVGPLLRQIRIRFRKFLCNGFGRACGVITCPAQCIQFVTKYRIGSILDALCNTFDAFGGFLFRIDGLRHEASLHQITGLVENFTRLVGACRP
ncbi:MAG: hypothetical protein VB858_15130, partial [Planctomycetaceae bacterium]